MSEIKRISAPLTDDDVKNLKAGDRVIINGKVLTGRDAAHKKLVELIDKGEDLPVDVKGQIIYYVGPTPAKPGDVIGAAGPTTSGRMDAYTPQVLKEGVKAIIGKGARSKEVKDALKENNAVYLAAIGGAAAKIKDSIKGCEIIAYEELGPEAIRHLEVEEFPVVVINDAHGNDLYEKGRKEYAQT